MIKYQNIGSRNSPTAPLTSRKFFIKCMPTARFRSDLPISYGFETYRQCEWKITIIPGRAYYEITRPSDIFYANFINWAMKKKKKRDLTHDAISPARIQICISMWMYIWCIFGFCCCCCCWLAVSYLLNTHICISAINVGFRCVKTTSKISNT